MRIPGLAALVSALFLLINKSAVTAGEVKRIQNATDLDEQTALNLSKSLVDLNESMREVNKTMQEVNAVMFSVEDAPDAKSIGKKAKRTKSPTVPTKAPTPLQVVWNKLGSIVGKPANLGWPYGYHVGDSREIYLVPARVNIKSPPSFLFGDGDNSFRIDFKPAKGNRAQMVYTAGKNVVSQANVVRGIKHMPVECLCVDGSMDPAFTIDGKQIYDVDDYKVLVSQKMFDPNNPPIITLSQERGDVSFSVSSSVILEVEGVVDGVHGRYAVSPSVWMMDTTMFWDGQFGNTPEGIAMKKSLANAFVKLPAGTYATAQRDFPDEALHSGRRLATDDQNIHKLARRFAQLRNVEFRKILKDKKLSAEDLTPEQYDAIVTEVNKVDLRAKYIEKYGEDELLNQVKASKLRGGKKG